MLTLISYNSVNVIYLISCMGCKQQYVRETSCKLKYRCSEHLHYSENGDDSSIASHFNAQGHCLDDILIIDIDLFLDWTITEKIRNSSRLMKHTLFSRSE